MSGEEDDLHEDRRFTRRFFFHTGLSAVLITRNFEHFLETKSTAQLTTLLLLQLFTAREEIAIQFKMNSGNFSIYILLCIQGTFKRHMLSP